MCVCCTPVNYIRLFYFKHCDKLFCNKNKTILKNYLTII